MKSRIIFFFVLIFTVGSFALPHIAHAGIPFFGPIIPKENVIVGGVSISQAVCPAGWGMLITVINNIIMFSITIAIVFIAPIMIAYAGFLYMWESDSPSGSTKARKILLNTVVGIVIALAGWLIVDAIMAVLYNPSSSEGWATKWSSIITSDSTKPCLDQKGTKPGDTLNQAIIPGVEVPGVVVVCSISSLTPLTGSLALQMEGEQTVIWTNTASQLQACVNKFIGAAGGGTVTSAYRPQAYQTHLWEIVTRWCAQGLKSNTDPACSALKNTVSVEVTKHQLSTCRPVAQSASTHGLGTGVDISSVPNEGSSATKNAASASCLRWYGAGDSVHYTLDLKIPNCSCQ